ncbi:hypothetical protein E4Z66_19535 [Aliishimia ponticola]|uniref:L-asparaginase N-terminal domain-containing protein n=1 Tax=Aliishimia ponticola TaxID=2499833 RepID=A0A4S4N563_9RHOB|nr:asparaginase domain-containing protein [Aliishimia ponticola]THH34206.1 hypothetical protein E4Z66_19535 [Aliishimia ponticola]
MRRAHQKTQTACVRKYARKAPSQPGRILIIELGGTISLELTDDRAVPTHNIHTLIGGLCNHLDVHSFAAKNSSEITLQDILDVGSYIHEHADAYSAFIVTTGTDTLEEVAYGLSLLLDDGTMVVVTGAMRPPFVADFDGMKSLNAAVELCENTRWGTGSVVVSVGGFVIPAWLAHKRSTTRLDAFVSTMSASLQSPEKAQSKLSTNLRAALLSHPELPSVDIPIVSLSVGACFQSTRYAGADGLVISCPGACSVATETRAALIQNILPFMPVVLASRCEDSHGDVSNYYPGHFDALEASGFRVREFLGLSAQKARVKLAFEVLAGRSELQR